jgi:hypothetical protein
MYRCTMSLIQITNMKKFIATFPTLTAVVFALMVFAITYTFIAATIALIGGFTFYDVARFPLTLFIGVITSLYAAIAAGEETQETGERWARESRPHQELIDACHWAIENNKNFRVVNGTFEQINVPASAFGGPNQPTIPQLVDWSIAQVNQRYTRH